MIPCLQQIAPIQHQLGLRVWSSFFYFAILAIPIDPTIKLIG
jgi:hypothetical protein